jgi:hypothetical protein
MHETVKFRFNFGGIMAAESRRDLVLRQTDISMSGCTYHEKPYNTLLVNAVVVRCCGSSSNNIPPAAASRAVLPPPPPTPWRRQQFESQPPF